MAVKPILNVTAKDLFSIYDILMTKMIWTVLLANYFHRVHHILIKI